MYDIKGRTSTLINDQLVTRTYYATARKDKSESAKVTAQMEATAKASRKAWGRQERQEEI